MLKAKLIKNAGSPSYNRWQINSHYAPQNKERGWDFIGNVYRSVELQRLGYLDSYEFYLYDPTTSEIIQMHFRNQWELMKFLTHIGNELRAKAKR